MAKGFLVGAGWPFRVVDRGIATVRYGVIAVDSIFFSPVRYSYYFTMNLIGVAVGSVTMGYGFCWLGMRWHRAWLSYIGLLYFFYLVAFGAYVFGMYTSSV